LERPARLTDPPSIGDSGPAYWMSPLIYLTVFVAVIAADQLSKRWAVRALPAVPAGAAVPGLGLARSRSPALDRLGGRGAALIWLLAGACGAALCLKAPGGGVAALGGVVAWAAAASNLGEWARGGGVVDWVRLWPRSLTNLADAALIVGSAQLAIWVAAS
jgi:lipoprotein signal peptidase